MTNDILIWDNAGLMSADINPYIDIQIKYNHPPCMLIYYCQCFFMPIQFSLGYIIACTCGFNIFTHGVYRPYIYQYITLRTIIL